MTEEILVNVVPHEVRIALLENTILQEVLIERSTQQGLLGNIYKGRVTRIMPGIQAAFIDFGLEDAGFLHVSDMRNYQEGMDIRDVLQTGRELLVQVYKDAIGSKGVRLTNQFTLPSRSLVLTPHHPFINVSQRIEDATERARLIAMLKSHDSSQSPHGYIFRTNAEGIDQDAIDADKKILDALWLEIETRAKTAKIGDLIYAEQPILFRLLRDLANDKLKKIRVDHQPTCEAMQAFAARAIPNLVEKIEYYASPHPIFDRYSVEDELQRALQRKVYLKSGGHLIFDQTEAMTTIDVNTGSFVGTGGLEQTIFKTNREAVEVIARQIRLRNLGGIIIVDFIDMNEPHHKEHLLQSLQAALKKDPAKTEVSELSSLGLVQMTRKRTRESLEHVLCQPCPTCQRRGHIKSVETIAYDIFRDLKRSAELFSWQGFLVLAAENVVNYLSNEQSVMLVALETELGKLIRLQVESSFTQEQYNILPISERNKA